MKKSLVFVGVAAAAIAALIVYLYATVPRGVTPAAAPFGSAAAALFANVPSGATDVAYARRASAVYEKALTDPVAGPSVREWSARAGLAHLPTLLGSADAVLWRAGDGGFGFAARPDPLRRALLHVYLFVSGRDELAMENGALVMNGGEANGGASSLVSEIESLAGGLPPADVIVLQREGSRGAFPPIGRPAVTAIRMGSGRLLLDSQSRIEEGTAGVTSSLPFAHPSGAMMSIAMATPPRLAGELNRLFARKVTPLLDHGGMLVVYDVDSRSLLPRPAGVVVLPGDEAHRAALSSFVDSVASLAGSAAGVSTRRVGTVDIETRDAFGMRVETAERGAELLLSFDRTSIERYLQSTPAPVDSARGVWHAVVIPSLALPVVARLTHNPGFRILSPKLYRAAGDLEKWMIALNNASRVDVRKDLGAGEERLHVTITAK